MPNDKDQNLSPDEGPEEEKYSFLQETIKSKPLSRRQLARQCVRIAIYGVILGAFACLGFFALRPWVRDERGVRPYGGRMPLSERTALSG